MNLENNIVIHRVFADESEIVLYYLQKIKQHTFRLQRGNDIKNKSPFISNYFAEKDCLFNITPEPKPGYCFKMELVEGQLRWRTTYPMECMKFYVANPGIITQVW